MEILNFDNQKEFDNWLEDFNKQTAKIYTNAKEFYLSQCANNNIKTIFSDCWSGKCVETEDYQNQFSKADYNEAMDIIMTAISNGFG